MGGSMMRLIELTPPGMNALLCARRAAVLPLMSFMLRSVRHGVYRLLRHEALQRLQIVRGAAGIVQQCCASSLVQGDGVLLAIQPALLYADTRRADRHARCEIYRPIECECVSSVLSRRCA